MWTRLPYMFYVKILNQSDDIRFVNVTCERGFHRERRGGARENYEFFFVVVVSWPIRVGHKFLIVGNFAMIYYVVNKWVASQ